MIKALFFDLDGTLLNEEKRIPESARLSLEKYRKKGVRFFIATARPPLLTKMLKLSPEEIEQFNALFDGGIYCNGGCVKVFGSVNYNFISPDVVQFCIEQAKCYENLNITLQLKNEIHAFRYPLAEYAYTEWGIEKSKTLLIENANICEVVKILLYYENLIDSVTEIPCSVTKALKDYCVGKAKFYLTDAGRVVQIVSKGINKYESIENIRKRLYLKKSEIAVFGDDSNDIEMLSNYENSVAMGNATSEVKTVARMITKANTNDGIAYAIDHLLPME